MLQNTPKFNFPEGELLLIDKPLEWSSFHVVNKIRNSILRKLKMRKLKVGHAGTLDPLATGLLIICTGKFTKKIESFQAQEKEYTGTFYLGASTPSFDCETEIDQTYPTEHISRELVIQTAEKFTGEIEQIPPLFSAIMVEGVRAYQHARNNKEIMLKSRKVTIDEFEITRIELPEIDFRVTCSKGTYIRSLARDFGKALNSGAYLKSLTRTRIGEFKLANSMSIEEFLKQLDSAYPEANVKKNN